MNPPVLTTHNLSCERNERLLFADLNVTLNPGEILHVQGENGAGKTSLLNMLCGLLKPSIGEIRWKGMLIEECRAEFMRDLFFLGHKAGIKLALTPLENIWINASLAGINTHKDYSEVIRNLNLEHVTENSCSELSAGQQRRVALAQLLLSSAKLWILDEPFSAIDQKGVAQLTDYLAAHQAQGKAAIITSHQPIKLPNVTVINLNEFI